MRRARDLFPPVVDFSNLDEAFIGARRGKRDRPEVREFDLILADNRQQAREYRAAVGSYLRDRLLLQLNPRRVVMAPLNHPRDVLGYVLHADGRVRVRRRSGRRLWRRLPALMRVTVSEPMKATRAKPYGYSTGSPLANSYTSLPSGRMPIRFSAEAGARQSRAPVSTRNSASKCRFDGVTGCTRVVTWVRPMPPV
jgi:hypothetical protein